MTISIFQNYLKICTLLSIFKVPTTLAHKKPNVLLILVDDLGFYDVSYHNNKKGPLTPNIDTLAESGVKLQNYYVQHICTPTRAALMTARYPMRDGLQTEVILAGQRQALPISPEIKIFPERLNECGYESHMVGKWHLGHFNRDRWPTRRGFKTFSGYLLGVEDYYSRFTCFGNWGRKQLRPCGLDFRENERAAATDPENAGMYSSLLYARKVGHIVDQHDFEEKPLFVYLPFQSVHYPVEVPLNYTKQFSWVKDETRRTYFGMVSALDEAVGKITDKLKAAGQLDNTLVIFTSDNGGRIDKGGNNWPFKGQKAEIWQGGVRSAGFIAGPGIPKNSTTNALFHVTDWLPTVLNLAGCKDPVDSRSQDGVNQASTLQTAGKPKARRVKRENVLEMERNPNEIFIAEPDHVPNTDVRHELLVNIDPIRGSKVKDDRTWIDTTFDIKSTAALVHGKWKIITGKPGNEKVWPPPEWGDGSVAFEFQEQPPNRTVFLYDLANDPEESTDVSDLHHDITNMLLRRLAHYQSLQTPPQKFPAMEQAASPKLHGGYWDSWVDSDA